MQACNHRQRGWLTIARGHVMASGGLSGLVRRQCGTILALFAAYDAIYLVVWMWQGGQPRFGDFFGLWSFIQFAISRPSGDIYDPVALQNFQHQLEPIFHGGEPFPYPPSFLLFLLPLAHLPYWVAYLAWICGTFVLYLLATLGRRWRSRAGLALLVAPTTLLTVISGQSGFLAAALLTAGMRNARMRPILAGFLLGLLSYKPQLGLLVPVALLAAGLWRSVVSACATIFVLILASSAAFGSSIWPRWFSAMPRNWELFEANRLPLNHLMPTVASNLLVLGASPAMARFAQIAVSGVVAVAIWICFRRGAADRAIRALQVGVFLATPYAFVYDMPMVTGAALLEAQNADRPFHAIEIAIAAFAVFVPLSMLRWNLPIESALLAMLFGLIVRRTVTSGAAKRFQTGQAQSDPI
jgi:hypothetical protein